MLEKSLKIACKLDNLKNIREYISSFSSLSNLTEIQLNEIILAIDEICANFMIHSNRCDETKSLELKLLEDSQGVKFQIVENSGCSFDTLNYKEPNIKKYILEGKKGGLGLMIVKKVMDEVEFSSINDKNICSLYKFLKK